MNKRLIGVAILALGISAQAGTPTERVTVLVNGAGGFVEAAAENMTALVNVKIKAADHEADYNFRSLVGLKNSVQYSQSSDKEAFAAAVSVMAINPNNTAHVVIDFNEDGHEKHVDANVRINEAADVVPSNSNVVFRLTVIHTPA